MGLAPPKNTSLSEIQAAGSSVKQGLLDSTKGSWCGDTAAGERPETAKSPSLSLWTQHPHAAVVAS